MKVKVCAAQMEVALWDVESNLNKAREMVKEASDQGCDIICFPEVFLTGSPGTEISRLADSIPGKHTDEFCELARSHGIHIVMGSIAETDGDRFYNTSVLIDSSGKILGSYRKINLWNGEKKLYHPGNSVQVFETEIGTIGLEICWDLAFPEISIEAARKGAQIIFCPSYWTQEDKYDITTCAQTRKRISSLETERVFVDACVQARAAENGVAYVYTNACGRITVGDRTRNMLGHSQIAVPLHGRTGLLEAQEGLLISEVDLSLSAVSESVYEIKKSREERGPLT